MPHFQDLQLSLGQIPLEQIQFDPQNRTALTRIFLGLQHFHNDEVLRSQIQKLLEDHFQPKTGKKVGRPGMPLWNILALALIKMSAKCRFDLLEHWANGDGLLRQFLGHGDLDSHCQYQRSTLIRNLNSLTPELLPRSIC